jgi:thioredoxin reductase
MRERLAAIVRSLSGRRLLALLGGALVLAAGVQVFGERPTASPGPLAEAHEPLVEGNCRACHAPFRRVGAGCVHCHGDLLEANQHRRANVGLAQRCVVCHREHGGEEFTLRTAERATCGDCHHAENIDAEAFHIEGFPSDPEVEPREPPGMIWAVVAGTTVTPELAAFLVLGTAGGVALLLLVPGKREDELRPDENVAPQRVPEMPVLSPDGESSVPGVFIIGECAGTPLINRAMKSGFDAIDFITNRLEMSGRTGGDDVVDVLIAGAGPAGLGAATKAKSLGLSYVLCEKSTPAATIQSYPRAKIVQAAPIDIPEYGTFFQEDDESKEGLVRRWQDIIARSGVVVHEREEVTAVSRDGDGLLVTEVTGGTRYRSRFVVLAIGNRGTPRRLGLAGETVERVAYLLIDPADYRERKILVVGGGNSACEAALALAAPELLNEVTLSHRGSVLKGVTPQNAQAVDNAAREGHLTVVADSALKEIREASVMLDTPGGPREVPNAFIFALVGAELPTKFLRTIGIRLRRKGGG